jgi:NADH dehydrogenase
MGREVVILGAGYGGSFLATNLTDSGLAVTLVDKRPSQELVQELHLVAAGFRMPEELVIPISNMVAGTNVNFVCDKVKSVDLRDRRVLTESGGISYDVLVIALGATTEYFDIPGAEKHTQPLRSLQEARDIHNHVEALIDSGGGEIVIIGGGPTGVGTAGALSDLIKQQAANHVSIKVLEANNTLLSGRDPRVAQESREVLEKKGVQIFLGSQVSECFPRRINLEDGRSIDFSLAIWTAGVKAYELDISPTVPKAGNGRILVNDSCQIQGWPDVYAIGDIAAAKNNSGGFYPATAQVAVRQAKYLADRLRGRKEERFDYEIKAQVLSLGIDDNILLLGNSIVTGSLAKLVGVLKGHV